MRYLALPLVFVSLVIGVLSGLWRAGFTAIDLGEASMYHGSLMTGSFLGALISLERAIVVKHWFAYLVPILAGLSLPFFFYDPYLSYALLGLSSLGLVAIMVWLYYQFQEWYHLIFIAGSACWLIGNVLIITGDYYFFAAPWWMLFFLFIITAERMELARFVLLQPSRIFYITLFLVLAFSGMLVPFHEGGKILLGLGFTGVALLLLRYDMARKNAKAHGIHRYSGYALLAAYAWLALSGLGMAILPYSGLMYDALLHSFFIGFVFSMILAHGPIILPTILKTGTHIFHRSLWLWLALLHLSLVLRIVADIATSAQLRLVGSWGNGIAILGFFITVMAIVLNKKIRPVTG